MSINGLITSTAISILSMVSGLAFGQDHVSLAGEWSFQLDSKKTGVSEQWYERDLDDRISLPGTTALAGKGNANRERYPNRLTPRFSYTGAAWYQKTIDIPSKWQGKRIRLFLERAKPGKVWLDGKEVGSQDSILVPHVYELGHNLAPGQHRLSILIDNSLQGFFYRSHAATEETQTNWNGIIGRIELQATDLVWIDSSRVFHDQDAIRLRVTLGRDGSDPILGHLTASASNPKQSTGDRPVAVTVPLRGAIAGQEIELKIPLGSWARSWDEFSPALTRINLALNGTSGGVAFRDERTLHAGLINFSAKGSQFQANGRTIFLRGKHDACVFPLTGHPPMDKEEWLRVMRISRSYGINHYRFHSWTPPHAAFEAADELGIYLQPELPFWGKYGEDPARDAYLLKEAKRILDAYGNHPSFVMMSLGNENAGSREVMANMVAEMRAHDSRHLYAQGANNYFWDPAQQPGDDYWTTMRTGKGTGEVRGSLAHADAPLGAVQIGPPNTMGDFSKAIEGVTIPVIGHEIGQYQVFPDLAEISKYTGVLQARNFEIVAARLKDKGMLDLASDFTMASGRLAAICYKADMEYALRTPGFGGFHLLDLQDFPGQGTALVGILNAFMESKGIISPEAWSQSCSDTTLLARLPSHTWTSSQVLEAEVKVANYGSRTLQNMPCSWTLTDTHGNTVSSGKLSPTTLQQGQLTTIGTLRSPLSGVVAPARLRLDVKLDDHPASNSYPIWVYPDDKQMDSTVKIVKRLDRETLAALNDGAKVLLSYAPDTRENVSINGFFAPDFWCYPMFRFGNPPGTMGLLLDPKHPALASFPTEFHSNWQWFDITMGSQPLILDDAPVGFRPIVQVIDNFDRCHRLGLVSEFKYGKGCLLVVAADLQALSDKPAPRQLLTSLTSYLNSDRCKPAFEIPSSLLTTLQESNLILGKQASASSSQDGCDAAMAIDGSSASRWCAGDATPNQWWQVDLGGNAKVSSVEIQWEMKKAYFYRLEGSSDGKTWKTLSDQTHNHLQSPTHRLPLRNESFRHLRINITGLGDRQWASLTEVRVFGML